jgi:hypothetical protein
MAGRFRAHRRGLPHVTYRTPARTARTPIRKPGFVHLFTRCAAQFAAPFEGRRFVARAQLRDECVMICLSIRGER